MLLLGFAASRLAKKLYAPHITGYLVAGLVIGLASMLPIVLQQKACSLVITCFIIEIVLLLIRLVVALIHPDVSQPRFFLLRYVQELQRLWR